MIDFRYHIVSLIAVFLALALGILLGAGPLNQTIGDQLTGQVEELREDRDRLRTELELAQAENEDTAVFVDGLAPDALASRLEGRSVAVVVVPGANEEDVAAVRTRLEQAGATVGAEVRLTEAWTDPALESFRSTYAGQLLGYLDPAPADDAGPASVLGVALGQALTGVDPATAELSPDAETLLDLLTSGDSPLVTVATEPTGAVNATVVVGPRSVGVAEVAEGEEPDTNEAQTRTAAYVDLTEALASTGEGSAVVGAATTALDLVTAIRADADATGVVTTVDSVDDVTGPVSIPLALAADISGDHGHYGFAEDAEAAVPPSVYLAPPAPPEPAPAGTDEPTDAAPDGEAEGGQP